MSRILRRPMFRGGRVDSRGTGITSGLSYKKGGRVGYKNAGSVGSLEGYSGPVRIPQSMIGNLPSWFDINRYPVIYKNYDDAGKYYIQRGGFGEKGTGAPMREVDAKEYPMFKFNTNPFSSDLGQPNEVGQDIRDYSRTRDMIDKQMALSGESTRTFDETNEDDDGNIDPPDLTPEVKDKTKAEKLAEYKEMFEEAYGTGKGEEFANMLMSFAGKALKTGADTKSAFSEFFEEESKRPSESKKYKDAATTAAINAFLAGESSYQKFQDDLSVFGKKLEMQKDFTKASETIDSLLSEFSKPAGKDKTDQGVMQSAFERAYADVPGFKGFEGKMPEDIEKNPLIVGAIYFDDIEGSSAKQVFIIDATGTPVKLKKVFK